MVAFFQPNTPIEQQPAENTADQANNPDSSKPKQDRVIRYRIEKEKKTPDGNLNVDMKEIFQELSLNLQEQIRSKSNLMDELSLLSKDVDDIKDETEDEQETTIPLTPEMERANGIYDQGMKLINATTNRQYEA